MKRAILTSTGFEDQEFAKLFLNETGIPANKIKVLFIPTAAVDEEAKAMLPKCRADLTDCGILPENITVYDLDRELTESEIESFNAIYVCGGSSEYLLERMNAVNFSGMLETAFSHNIIYIGVSAGSIVCGTGLENGLRLFGGKIGVHCPLGSWDSVHADLTDDQAMWIRGDEIVILPENDSVDSRCGLHCTGCGFKKSCGCGGCIETNGHPFHGECPVAACCQNRGYVHCGECPDIPCELLMDYSCDPENGDSSKGARIRQCLKWDRAQK